MKHLTAFACGWLFALGLGIAGMTQPAKIIGFLDLAGTWDASLLLVMAAAVSVGLVGFALILKRQSPLLAPHFILSQNNVIDRKLVFGAALFGLGWGLSGYCPGPAFVSLVSGHFSVFVFVVAMLAGLRIGQWIADKTTP